jgi:hypothetical protein
VSELEVIDCEQGDPGWFQARVGIVTASEFHSVLAKGEGKTRRKYMLRLIAERITGEPQETYTNAVMERGKLMEAEARDYYAFMTGVEPVRVGFLKRGRVGCSPDSLIGDNGLHEIKCKESHLHLEVLIADRLPPAHVAQCQGSLWVSNREWIDFQSYWPKLNPFIKRVYRDENYIKNLSSEVDAFIDEMDTLYERITGTEDLEAKLKASLATSERT